MWCMVKKMMNALRMKKPTNSRSLGKCPGSTSVIFHPHVHDPFQPEATEELAFSMLGQPIGDESEEDDEKEKEAEQTNAAEKDRDWGSFRNTSQSKDRCYVIYNVQIYSILVPCSIYDTQESSSSTTFENLWHLFSSWGHVNVNMSKGYKCIHPDLIRTVYSRSSASLWPSHHHWWIDRPSFLIWLPNWKWSLEIRMRNLLMESVFPSPIPSYSYDGWTLNLRTCQVRTLLNSLDCWSHPFLRAVRLLDESIEILNDQFGACELVKLDAAVLKTNAPDGEKQSFLGFTCFGPKYNHGEE